MLPTYGTLRPPSMLPVLCTTVLGCLSALRYSYVAVCLSTPCCVCCMCKIPHQPAWPSVPAWVLTNLSVPLHG